MILTIGTTKGGTGKSTIACNLSVEFALSGKKTLLVDADVQASSMSFRALREKDDVKAIAINKPTLHQDLQDFRDFQIIIVDAGGRDNAVFRSALIAGDLLLIPVLPSQLDVWATGDTLDLLREARTYKKLPAYFLLNQVVPGTRVSREAIKALGDISKDAKLLKTIIHSRVAFKNSIPAGQGVSEYEPKGKAAEEMRSLYREVLRVARRERK